MYKQREIGIVEKTLMALSQTEVRKYYIAEGSFDRRMKALQTRLDALKRLPNMPTRHPTQWTLWLNCVIEHDGVVPSPRVLEHYQRYFAAGRSPLEAVLLIIGEDS